MLFAIYSKGYFKWRFNDWYGIKFIFWLFIIYIELVFLSRHLKNRKTYDLDKNIISAPLNTLVGSQTNVKYKL
jgi:hypothetical protein